MGIARSIPYCGREILVGPILVEVPRKVCREKTTTVVLFALGMAWHKPTLGHHNNTRPNTQNCMRFLVFIGDNLGGTRDCSLHRSFERCSPECQGRYDTKSSTNARGSAGPRDCVLNGKVYVIGGFAHHRDLPRLPHRAPRPLPQAKPSAMTSPAPTGSSPPRSG